MMPLKPAYLRRLLEGGKRCYNPPCPLGIIRPKPGRFASRPRSPLGLPRPDKEVPCSAIPAGVQSPISDSR